MAWLEISRLFAVIGSMIITLGLYDQARKVWRTKSVDDLSTALVLSLVINESVWLNYGTALREWPIVLVSGVNIPAVALIAVGYLRHKNKFKRGGEPLDPCKRVAV